jgi:GntR family transcriptional repressor for pyruvate dehydrogenase complex
MSLTNEIIAVLRGDITSGRLSRGDQLPSEKELARQFGVSQPSVREATRALEALGLIEVRHGTGAFVTGDPNRLISASMEALLEMDPVSIADIVGLRIALGTYAIERVVEYATDEELQRIVDAEKNAAASREYGDQSAASQATVSFMAAITHAAHHPLLFAIDSFLIKLLIEIHVVAFAERGDAFWRTWAAQFDPIRRELAERLVARDKEGSIRALTSYLDVQREKFEEEEPLARIDSTVIRNLPDIPINLVPVSQVSHKD